MPFACTNNYTDQIIYVIIEITWSNTELGLIYCVCSGSDVPGSLQRDAKNMIWPQRISQQKCKGEKKDTIQSPRYNPLSLNRDAKQYAEHSQIRKLNLISICVKSIYHVNVQFLRNDQLGEERYKTPEAKSLSPDAWEWEGHSGHCLRRRNLKYRKLYHFIKCYLVLYLFYVFLHFAFNTCCLIWCFIACLFFIHYGNISFLLLYFVVFDFIFVLFNISFRDCFFFYYFIFNMHHNYSGIEHILRS